MCESCKLSAPCPGFESGTLDIPWQFPLADRACSLQIHWADKLFCSSWAFVFQLVSLRRGKGNTFTYCHGCKIRHSKGKSAPFVCYWVSCEEMGGRECVWDLQIWNIQWQKHLNGTRLAVILLKQLHLHLMLTSPQLIINTVTAKGWQKLHKGYCFCTKSAGLFWRPSLVQSVTEACELSSVEGEGVRAVPAPPGHSKQP